MKSFKNDYLNDNLLRSYFDSKLLTETNSRNISDTSLQNQINTKINSSEKGAAAGLATLGPDGILVSNQRPTVLASNITQDSTHRLVTDTEKTNWNGACTPDWNVIQNKPLTFPPSSHDHNTNYYTKTQKSILHFFQKGERVRFLRQILPKTQRTGLLPIPKEPLGTPVAADLMSGM
ncbi:hypothetical protein FH581_023500 (plasmid) [Leptospira weilii]|nr:hypothetical protein [Leptospira weilii]UPY81139.1 hypothetical protein FH581_023075 [Leptospira weilii]UPY81216.1 hypothetical protein FH581_023500 [Leptospira weilii]